MSLVRNNVHLDPMVAGILASLSLAALGWVDYISGPELGFFIFYFIPVAIATWFGNPKWGFVLALASASTSFAVDRLTGLTYTWEGFRFWNAGIRFLSFVIVAMGLQKISSLFIAQLEANRRLSAALQEVKELKGLLPVCSCCRRVRDDQGYWGKIEDYLSHHTNAEIHFAICPHCADKIMPNSQEIIQAGCVGSGR